MYMLLVLQPLQIIFPELPGTLPCRSLAVFSAPGTGRVGRIAGAMDGWPKPVACAALATVLASGGDHWAQGKVPGLIEAETQGG